MSVKQSEEHTLIHAFHTSFVSSGTFPTSCLSSHGVMHRRFQLLACNSELFQVLVYHLMHMYFKVFVCILVTFKHFQAVCQPELNYSKFKICPNHMSKQVWYTYLYHDWAPGEFQRIVNACPTACDM